MPRWTGGAKKTAQQLIAIEFLPTRERSSRAGARWQSVDSGRVDTPSDAHISPIPPPALPFGLALQGGEGLRFGHVPFVRHAPACARGCISSGRDRRSIFQLVPG